ncbi:cysteine peptidase family C39 domain-containing protein [Pontiellaceae bacterium B1224]|nr:cysteine peptidase family C39 domain-containing protein [Pontiellaceae bacterium B1224]
MRWLWMGYVQSAILKGAGILVLIALSWFGARLLARWRFWWIGLIPPLLIIGVLIAERWLPGRLPVAWVVSGRREFVLLAFAIPLLLVTPGRHLPVVRQRRLVQLMALVLTLWVSLSPFLAPAFEYSSQSELETFIDQDGICLQSNGYNCGPAAAVTVLRRMGIPAEEGALAVAAYTTQFTGTPADCLTNAILELYDVQCSIDQKGTLVDLKGSIPFIAAVKHALMVDHYVVVLEVTDSHVQVGDPLKGLKQWTHEEFNQKWRGQSILFGP